MTELDSNASTYEAIREGFDQLAGRYQSDMYRQASILLRYRHRLHRCYDRYLGARARVLEIGCGTGEETLYLLRSGRSVLATDLSSNMVNLTRERAAEALLSERLHTQVGGGPDFFSALDLEAETIDGVISSLGPLNCEPDLAGVARALAERLRPGTPLILSPMSRICPWEIAVQLVIGHPRQALRRLRRGPVLVQLEHHAVPVWYFTPREFLRPFAPWFGCVEVRGLGVFLPPPYLWRLKNLPGLLTSLDWLENLAGLPGLNQVGDHTLMVLRRRN